MRLTNLRLVNFRNHGETRVPAVNAVNVFLGDNGEGKTNVLEAIAYLCLSKSFFSGGDRVALQIGKEFFAVEGDFVADNTTCFAVRVLYNAPSGEKKIWVNKAELETLSTIVGKFPVVVLSPEGGAITAGAPVDRRKFIDLVLSQASRVYLDKVLEYRNILKQRNKVLFDAKISRQDCTELLEPWDVQLVDLGASVSERRAEFVREFSSYVSDAFQRLTGESETPAMQYRSSVVTHGSESNGELREQFRKQLSEQHDEERRAGTTLVGPHRDEIGFTINGLDLRTFASQGQHKTFLVALKIAEFYYLKERCNETPLLLLDDVFSELDEHRTRQVLRLMQSLGQTFLTSTNEQLFSGKLAWNSAAKKFSVHQGVVTYEETGSLVH
jgi:DNA replication and repair protein RecF